MKKTAALFGTAALLVVGAIAVDLWHRLTSAPASIETVQPADPVPLPSSPQAIAGKGTARIGDLVVLDAALSNDFVRASSGGDLFLRMNLQAKDTPGTVRAPLALAVVIDRSGSMAGEKMDQAREAAKRLVDRLGDGDHLAIISYATDYTVDLPLVQIGATDRARIHRVIDQIYDGGGTNLSGGLEAGLGELRRIADRGLVARVLLLSDGNANQGITDPRELARISREARQRGYTVSTLGVGLDFNEDVMTLIAESAGGAYYYVRDGGAIARALDSEFDGLSALAARRVEVGLELGEGVVVKEVYGYRTESRGGRLVIPVGDITSGQKRQVVVRLSIQPGVAGELGVADLALSYTAADSDASREHHAGLTVSATEDLSQLDTHQRRDVIETAEAILAAEARKQAATSFQDGHKGRAVRQLNDQLDRTRAKAAALGSQVLLEQAREIESTLNDLGNTSDSASAEGKDLVKREKYRARQIFVY